MTLAPELAPDALCAAGTITRFDARFAALMRSLAGVDEPAADLVAFAAALACARSGRQDAFVDLARLAANDPLEANGALAYPDADALLAALRRSAVVGEARADAPPRDRPLVLDGTRLYLARQYEHECALGAALAARARQDDALDDTRVNGLDDTRVNALGAALAVYFPDVPAPELNWQRIAAAMTLTRRLTVITGGPGTGKTTTVTRALALLLQLQPDARIALAAPTGKAAARLGEAVRQAKARLGAEVAGAAAEALLRVPDQGETLHRLLRYRPLENRFGYGADDPLPYDVLVIDEASMLDLRLARAALAALPDDARLLLVGDKDQLSSVDAGRVLGDICAGLATRYDAARFSRTAASRLAALTGYDLAPLAADAVPPLADSLAWLRVSHRFDAAGGIGRLASAINDGDVDALLAACAEHEGLRAQPDVQHLARHALPAFTQLARDAAAGDAAAALHALDGFRVLCAVREGRDGVDAANRAIARLLAQAGAAPHGAEPRAGDVRTLYPGLPVMVVRNDARSGLFNGDVGVVLRAGGELRVAFPGAGDAPRELAPARLPPWEPVYAMTIHKSQGSEFREVAVVLPRAPSANEARLLTRELLYTGVTRAREGVRLYATDEVLRAAVATRTVRASGLADRLWR